MCLYSWKSINHCNQINGFESREKNASNQNPHCRAHEIRSKKKCWFLKSNKVLLGRRGVHREIIMVFCWAIHLIPCGQSAGGRERKTISMNSDHYFEEGGKYPVLLSNSIIKLGAPCAPALHWHEKNPSVFVYLGPLEFTELLTKQPIKVDFDSQCWSSKVDTVWEKKSVLLWSVLALCTARIKISKQLHTHIVFRSNET